MSEQDDFFDALDGDALAEVPSGLAAEQLTLNEMVDLSESPSDFHDVVGDGGAADALLADGLDEVVGGGMVGWLAGTGRSVRRIFEDSNDDDVDVNHVDQLLQNDGSQFSQITAAQESSRNVTTAAA